VEFIPFSWKWSLILDFDPPVYRKTVRKACIKKIRNLSHKFRETITPTRYTYEIGKVSRRFGCFFLTFASSICFKCRVKFCIEWPGFQGDRLGRILWVWIKILCFWPCSAGMSRISLLLRPVFTIWLVLLDAELNSALNGSSFKGIVLEEYCGFGSKYCVFGLVLLVCLGETFFAICDCFRVRFARCRIKFWIGWPQFQRKHLGKIREFGPKYSVFCLFC